VLAHFNTTNGKWAYVMPLSIVVLPEYSGRQEELPQATTSNHHARASKTLPCTALDAKVSI
jgi:hypothetical protein